VVGSRGLACVMIDEESLESVISELDAQVEKGGERDLGKFDMWGVTWVWLVSEQWEGYGDGSEEEDEDANDGDGGEGTEEEKVSTARVGISYLVPGAYELLDGPGWHSFVKPGGRVVTL